MLIHLLLAAAIAGLAVPQTVPIYDLDEAGVSQRVVRTDYGGLRAAFPWQDNFTDNLKQTTPKSGMLVLRSGVRGAETSTDVVATHKGEISASTGLVSMRFWLTGMTPSLRGDEMCRQTTGIVTGE